MSECRTRYRLIRRLQRLREQSPEQPAAREGRPDAHAGPPSGHAERSVQPGLDVDGLVDADRLARDVARYLSAVDLFRAEGAGPRWAPERTPPEWWVTEWTVHH